MIVELNLKFFRYINIPKQFKEYDIVVDNKHGAINCNSLEELKQKTIQILEEKYGNKDNQTK